MVKILPLESLRGIAACIVFLCHFFILFSTPSEIFPSFLLPFLNGSAAVYLFFILSGFVLSQKFFLHYSSRTLFASVIKRFFRLFPMVFITSFICWFLSCFDLFYCFDNQNPYHPSLNLLSVLWESVFVFVDGRHFNNVFWTMRFELIGSILVFLMIFLAHKLQSLISPPPQTNPSCCICSSCTLFYSSYYAS